MADAPSTSTYILVTPDAIDLPNSRTLYADAFGSQLEYVDGGPAGQIEIRPTLTLKSITELNAAGILAFDNANTVTPRTLTSISTLNITNGNGLAGNPILDVINDTSIQKVSISVNGGANVGSRSQLNLINGLGVSISAVENAGDNTIDITINASNPPDVGSFVLASTTLGHTANLGLLSTGILKINVAGGIATPVIAAAGIDYVAPTTPLLQLSGCVSSVGSLIHGTAGGWQTLPVGTANQVLTVVAGEAAWADTALASNATYITRNDTNLPPNGFSLGSLTSGLLKITVAGLSATPSTAVAGTDYLLPNANLNQLATCGAGTGTIIYANGSGWQTLTPGTNGQVLTLTGGNVGWATPSLSSTATFLCRTGTDLPTNGVNLSAAGAYLSIGKNTTGTVLDLENSPPTSTTVLKLTSNDAYIITEGTTYSGSPASGTGNILAYRAYRGTSASPVATASGDKIFDLQFWGYTGSTLRIGAAITAQAASNYTAGHSPTAIKFFTEGALGTGAIERGKIAANGTLWLTTNELGSAGESNTSLNQFVGAATGVPYIRGIYQQLRPAATVGYTSDAFVSEMDNGNNNGGGGSRLFVYSGYNPVEHNGPDRAFYHCRGNLGFPAVSQALDHLGYASWYACTSTSGATPNFSLLGNIEVQPVVDLNNSRMIFRSLSSLAGGLVPVAFYRGRVIIGDISDLPGTAGHQLQLSSTTGTNPVSANWVNTSDERIKHNIKDISDGLATIKALQPRTFQYTQERVDQINKSSSGSCGFTCEDTFYGFIAQEVEKVVPCAVTTTKTKIGEHENIKTFDIHSLNVILFQGVKELAANVTTLEAELTAQATHVSDLETQVIALEGLVTAQATQLSTLEARIAALEAVKV